MRFLSYSFIVLLAIILVGCQDLSVDNESNPNREQVLAEPADLQSVAAGTFESFHRGTEGQATIGGADSRSPSLATAVTADAHTASWGNFAMRESGEEPRVNWNNDPSYRYAEVNEQPYFQSYTTISNVIDVLVAIENIGASSINNDLGEGAAARMEAFVHFNMGLSYMYLAARFDKGALIDETDEFQGEEFVAWPQVLQFGVDKMNRAIEVANNNSFTIPGNANWFFGNEMTSSELAALANSLKAKYVTLAARTPDQRASLSYIDGVDWSTVNTWLDNGMRSVGYSSGVFGPRSIYAGSPAGFFPNALPGVGFPRQYDGELHFAQSEPFADTWARADYKSIGPANTATYSNGENKYDHWKKELDNSPGDGVEASDTYLTESPDARIVGPDPTCGQLVGRAGFPEGVCGGRPSSVLENGGDGLYFGFRGTVTVSGGELVPTPFQGPFPPGRGRWHFSDRAHDRYISWQRPSGDGAFLGPMPHTLKAEMDLLKAEALIQTGGDLSTAAALINNTRAAKGGLPPAEASDGAGTIDGQGLNPLKNPVGTDFAEGRGESATLYSMLKYEYIIETWSTSSGVAWMAKRGWGDLQTGTLLHYPVPGSELETLGEEFYTFGGAGGDCSAGNVTNCSKPFGNGGGGGATIVLDEKNSHWSSLPNAHGESSGASITLDTQ